MNLGDCCNSSKAAFEADSVGAVPTSPARGITSRYDVGSYLLSGSKAERRCLNDVSMPDTRVQTPQIALVMKKIIFKMSIGRIAQTILVKVLKNRVGESGKDAHYKNAKKISTLHIVCR